MQSNFLANSKSLLDLDHCGFGKVKHQLMGYLTVVRPCAFSHKRQKWITQGSGPAVSSRRISSRQATFQLNQECSFQYRPSYRSTLPEQPMGSQSLDSHSLTLQAFDAEILTVAPGISTRLKF
ncbi:hypothetical protein EDB85DRAFT_1897527 [Lactarius pseudohatsudake]|nr:hypothetical protein EDB85DRAFT_1897527 [Lactarius pseudohatsudake]